MHSRGKRWQGPEDGVFCVPGRTSASRIYLGRWRSLYQVQSLLDSTNYPTAPLQGIWQATLVPDQMLVSRQTALPLVICGRDKKIILSSLLDITRLNYTIFVLNASCLLEFLVSNDFRGDGSVLRRSTFQMLVPCMWQIYFNRIWNSFHQEGFVHGDLRAANIICKGDQVFLIGFD